MGFIYHKAKNYKKQQPHNNSIYRIAQYGINLREKNYIQANRNKKIFQFEAAAAASLALKSFLRIFPVGDFGIAWMKYTLCNLL